MVTHAFDSRIQEAEAGGSLWVWSQPGLLNRFLGYTMRPCLKIKISPPFIGSTHKLTTLHHNRPPMTYKVSCSLYIAFWPYLKVPIVLTMNFNLIWTSAQTSRISSEIQDRLLTVSSCKIKKQAKLSTYSTCLSQGSLSPKASQEEKGIFGLHFYIVPQHWGSQDRNLSRAGTWRQELKQKPWRDAAYWLLALTCSVAFL